MLTFRCGDIKKQNRNYPVNVNSKLRKTTKNKKKNPKKPGLPY